MDRYKLGFAARCQHACGNRKISTHREVQEEHRHGVVGHREGDGSRGAKEGVLGQGSAERDEEDEASSRRMSTRAGRDEGADGRRQ